MLQRLLQLLGVAAEPGPPGSDYDPIYGLSRRAINDWLARNPQLKREHDAQLRLLSPPTACTAPALRREAGKPERLAPVAGA